MHVFFSRVDEALLYILNSTVFMFTLYFWWQFNCYLINNLYAVRSFFIGAMKYKKLYLFRKFHRFKEIHVMYVNKSMHIFKVKSF